MPLQTDAPYEMVLALARGLKDAAGHTPDSPINKGITEPLQKALKEAAGNMDGVRIEIVERGVKCGKRLVPKSAPGATPLIDHFLTRGVRSAFFPKLTGVRDVWNFLTIIGMAPEEIDQAGGPLQCVLSTGTRVIRIEEQPPVVGAAVSSAGPLGGSVEVSSKDSFVLITQEIVRSFQLDGPDAVAMGLLMAWQRMQMQHGNGGLPIDSIAKILPRLDPVVTFTVLSRLAGKDDGRALAEKLNDAAVGTAVAAAIVARMPGVENSAFAVCMSARPDPAARNALLGAIYQRLGAADLGNDPAWKALHAKAHTEGAGGTILKNNPRTVATDTGPVSKVIERLAKSENRTERKQLCVELASHGAEAVPYIMTATREGPWFLMRNLLRVLGDIGDPAGTPAAVRLLRHPHTRVRTEAIRALGKMSSKDGIALLAKVSGAYGEKALRSAFGAQGVHLENDVVIGFRTEAIAVLGTSGSPDAVPALERLLLDPPVHRKQVADVRTQAARALSQNGSARAGAVLEDAVRSGSEPVQQATRAALSRR